MSDREPGLRGGVAPGTRRQVGLFTWLFAHAAGRVARTGPPNLFLVLGRHRGLFLGWLHFAGRLMPGGLLSRRDTELVILRVAHLSGCRYELEHHRRLARRAGVSTAELERVAGGPDEPGWGVRDRVLLNAVDRLHHYRDLDDAAWAGLREHLTPRQAIELCLLVGHYQMLATTISALRIEAD